MPSNDAAERDSYITIKRVGERRVFYSSRMGAFWSLGINVFFGTSQNDPLTTLVQKSDQSQLYQEQLQNALDLGFNTIGGWSETKWLHDQTPFGIVLFDDDEMPLVDPLEDGSGKKLTSVLIDPDAKFPMRDPYSIPYQRAVDIYIRNKVQPASKMLLCYWLGNEFALGDSESMDFSSYIYSKGVSGRLAEWLGKKYQTVPHLNETWGTSFHNFREAAGDKGVRTSTQQSDLKDFGIVVIHDWLSLIVRTIRKYDPHHLISSPRFSSYDQTWKGDSFRYLSAPIAMGQFEAFRGLFDLLSINLYTANPTFPAELMDQLNGISDSLGLPILVSEFGTRQKISGWTNKGFGAKTFVNSQEDRADRYESQVMQFFSNPRYVGAHWFRWADHNSSKSQFNKGMVYVDRDQVVLYPVLTERMKVIHKRIFETIHKLDTSH